MKPPTQEIVARRALCLWALVWRAEFETVIQEIPEPTVKQINEEMIVDLKEWISRENLKQSQSQEEASLFSIPAGGWNRQQLIDSHWRAESLGTILWALSLVDAVPLYDTEFGTESVVQTIGLMRPTIEFFDKIKLRFEEQLEKARDIAELWHWRARTTQIMQEGKKPPAGLSYDQILKITAESAYASGEIPRPIRDDFPAYGKAYKDLSEDEFSIAMSISIERHFALNWLCGYSEDWDRTPTDT